ncbi:bifunctional purine biosynthesis protein PurH [Arthrobacter sp. Hiyo4]|nr:bifunctional purine biosynthesis protein PurH [Arthrobacter sp. Hiyo4]
MSYNNFVDADAALRAAFDFAEPAVAIIKHANPCGVAVGSADAADPIADAHAKAHACDPVSAFGGVIAANRTVTAAMAQTVAGIFTEVVIAPDFEPAAVEILAKKKNIRLLALPEGYDRYPAEMRQVSGGVLVQMSDKVDADGDNPPTGPSPPAKPLTKRPSRTSPSPGPPAAPPSPTPSCSPITAQPWASAWARSTGWTPAAWPSSVPTRWAFRWSPTSTVRAVRLVRRQQRRALHPSVPAAPSQPPMRSSRSLTACRS